MMRTNEVRRENREFNYYFNIGDKITLDTTVMTSYELEKYENIIGVGGVITECYSDFHAFSRGSAYQHQISFDNGIKTTPFGSDNYFYVPTELLISFKGG